MEPILKSAYSAENFRESAHRVVDILADHIKASTSGQNEQALPWMEPEDSIEHWRQMGATGATIEQICREVIARSVRIDDPKYIGHQICTPAPVAMIAGLITDTINNGSGVYEMGMAGTAMERFVIQTVAKRFGMDDRANGFMTSGGTLANLTALLAARSIKSGGNDWSVGTSQKLALMVSDQSHYCIERAARIMGWGDDGLIKVPADDRFCMRTDLLPKLFEQATSEGRKVIAVVGSACSTSTGSFDNLRAIGDFCGKHDLWFHVDGAHGAAVAFSDKHRGLLDGIESADSVTLDFHKMLMTPVITSALVFRRGEDGFRTFAVEADYLFTSDGERSELDWYNIAKRSFECTKTMMSTKVFSILATHGLELFAANIDHLHELTAKFVDRIRQRDRFELAVEPQTNIVCFRYVGARVRSSKELSSLNARIRAELTREGKYYIVQTSLRGETWLRTVVTNPFTTEQEFDGVLDAIEARGEVAV